MHYRRLGSSGLKVSEVCLGSWLTYGGATEDETAERCIHRAYELGINFFDTANVYARGKSEEVVGKSLRTYPRSTYVVATKVFFRWMMDRCLTPRAIAQARYGAVRSQPEAPGARLHRSLPVPSVRSGDSVGRVLRALDDLVTQGKVIYLGFSQWTAPQSPMRWHSRQNTIWTDLCPVSPITICLAARSRRR